MMSVANYSIMPGQAKRDPGISCRKKGVDGRVKPGHDK
jgi:hypothetical protein